MQKILIVIPTYNEAKNIERLVKSIEEVSLQESYSLSLLIVDDRSPDGTAKIINELNHRYGNINLLSANKSGLGQAYIRGFTYALKHIDFDILLTMDADFSHNPTDIPLLIRGVDENTDYVIGSRYVTGSKIDPRWSLKRKILSRIANFITRQLIGYGGIEDMTGGFKAIKRSALAAINLKELAVNGYIFQVSLLNACLRQGLTVREVPINFSEREYGKSKLRIRDVLEFCYKAYMLNPDTSIHKIIRFGTVGMFGTIVNLSILSILVKEVGVGALIADLIAIEVSILFNFSLNHYYTFQSNKSSSFKLNTEYLFSLAKKAIKFNLGAAGGATISFTVFTLLFRLIGLQYLVADILAISTAMSWNYFISIRFVWKVIDAQ